MSLILLAANAYEGACTFAEINQGSWININMIVIFLAVMVGIAIYTIAVLLPASTRERLRGAARTEAFQAIISLFIIIILLGFAFTACQAGESLTGELTAGLYHDPMQFSQQYLGNLLFVRAQQIFGDMYAKSATFLIDGHIAEQIAESINVIIQGYLGIELNPNVTGVYFGYTGVLTGTYTALLVAAYAVLFVFYILLPIVQALALTVLLPLTIVMRSWPFGGPRLREAANAFLGIAIAFYFVLPLMITFNNYVVNWMYCSSYDGSGTPLQLSSQNCNPYSNYVSFTNAFPALQTSTLFAANQPLTLSGFGGGALSMPYDFFGGTISGSGGVISLLTGMLKNLFELPLVIVQYGYVIAEYMFESIVLMALDIAVTIGFAQGLSKGLGAVSGALGSGPFWGNV